MGDTISDGGDANSEEDPVLASTLRSLASKLKGQGPQTGIFTDGSCNPNPGPGGWGVVAVRDGKVLCSGGSNS